MPLPDCSSLVENPDYLADLGCGVWLMDDHRWALKVWETQRKHHAYTLVHADFHWDACYDYHYSVEEEAKLLAASSAEVGELVANDDWIRYDSFIAPAIKRGLIHTVHFYCLQDGPGDNGLYEEFMTACQATQVLHKTPQELASARIDGPYIFDLCLDLFNRCDDWEEGDLWKDQEVIAFLETVRHLIVRAEIATVSLSFNYSGTHEDTRHLAALVLPILLTYRGDA